MSEDLMPQSILLNPLSILYSIPSQTKADIISLLAYCGYNVIVNDPPPEPPRPFNPYRDLACGIILQAIDDALYAMGQERWQARYWLLNDLDWFPTYCRVIDLDFVIVRKHLHEKLDGKWYRKTSCSRHQAGNRRKEATHEVGH